VALHLVLNQCSFSANCLQRYIVCLSRQNLLMCYLYFQEKDAHKRSISVARCYPMKNRFPDILPYDHSRIELPSTKDDYINASYMKNLTPLAPPFIVTQAPLPSTYADFWTMVWEQQVEVIVCLLSDSEVTGTFLTYRLFVRLVVKHRMWDLFWGVCF